MEDIFKDLTDEATPRVRAAMIAVVDESVSEADADASIAELGRLLDTAGADGVVSMIQRRPHPDNRTYLGSGKCAELKTLCENENITLVVADSELSPMQIRNLEDEVEVRVIDRSMLILDIFALHAGSGEGKLQVEIAQMKYTIPRLTGKGTELSRLGGGIGTRGPGETKLESDRRHLRRRIFALEEQLATLEKSRATQRAARERAGIFRLAIAGYTNAGKSTLLNALTGAGVLSEDKLFATLDPTTRKFTLPSGREVLLTDTVGFIRNLPHHLIRAFRSTLDEVKYADAILVVADATDPHSEEQLAVTRDLIGELGGADKEVLLVYNKCDELASVPPDGESVIHVSAKTGASLDKLVERIEALAAGGKTRVSYLFPPSEGGRVARLYEACTVESVEYTPEGTEVIALVDERHRGLLKQWEK